MAAWATVKDVVDLTGKTVAESDVAVAQGHIETAAGRVYGEGTFTDADLGRLRKAVAYQAARVAANPNLGEQQQVRSERFGEMSRTYHDPPDSGGDGGGVLSPLAVMALRGLSWRRRRGIQPVAIVRRGRDEVDLPDDYYQWTPYP
jgi:hypothetical protein